VQTGIAIPAPLPDDTADDPVTGLHICNAGADGVNNGGDLMASRGAALEGAVLTADAVDIAVADGTCHNFEADFFFPGLGKLHHLDGKRLAHSFNYSYSAFHIMCPLFNFSNYLMEPPPSTEIVSPTI
jgi:hypothetical protein